MIKIVILILFIFFSRPVNAYESESVGLVIQDNGNWELRLDNTIYYFDFFYNGDDKYLRVSGGGQCYWLYEVDDNLIQSDC